MNAVTQKASAAKSTAVHASLFQALAAAQSEMGPALKDSTNPAFKTRYADLASVMAACLPALNAHGIAVIQPPVEEDGGRYVKTVLIHGETGQTTECRVPLIVGKNDMQGYGSAVTYARRYGLMAMAGVAPDDDDGNAAAAAAPKPEARQEAPRQQPPAQKPAEKRDPDAVKASLLGAIAKADAAEKLDDLNADGTKFAAAWQWLEDEHSALSTEVKAAFDARREVLTSKPDSVAFDEIPY